MTKADALDPKSIADHEHQAWQGAAPVYADHVAAMTALSGQCELIQEVAELNTKSTVLDVGCGPGLLTAQLANFAQRIVGIDFSANMITEAKSRFPQLEFHEADAENTSFDDHTFDCVVVNYCAHHLARPEKAFTELRRIIKLGGRIVIVHPIQSRQASWGSFARAMEEELPPETIPSGPLLNVEKPAEYVSLLNSCGFTNSKCETRLKPVVLESIDKLLSSAWAITGLDAEPEALATAPSSRSGMPVASMATKPQRR